MRRQFYLFTILFALAVALLSGCSIALGNGAPTPNTPVISQLSPSSGPIGTVVKITGSNFTPTGNVIKFGPDQGTHRPDGTSTNVRDTVDSADGKTVSLTVPDALVSGIVCDKDNHCIGIAALPLQPGSYPVQVTNANGSSNVIQFTATK